MHTFKELKKNLRREQLPPKACRVALVGDTATQLLATALRGEAIGRGFDVELFEAEYNQIERQFLDPQSELRAFMADFIVLFQSTHKLGEYHSMLSTGRQRLLAEERLAMVDGICRDEAFATTKIICMNYPEIDDAVFGSYANKVDSSFTFQVRKLNTGLMELSEQHANLFVCDLAALQAKLGRDQMFAPNVYVSTEMVLSIEALPWVASRVIDIIGAVRGQFKKCLILDLDNTLWGGVIGDDGIDGIQLGELGDGPAFAALQHWLLELKRRGLLLAVCSKNNDDTAREPFEKHPESVLRLEDFAAFVANWENKAQNIRQIRQTLNIGMDSFVFLDDNPFERNLVREMIPEVTVPELPEDPSAVPAFLESLHLFEAVSFSEEDAARTAQYQAEAGRAAAQAKFASYDEYLQALDMQGEIKPFDSFHFPRIAQLTQRSNQFNLRTVRYSEADIAAIAADPDYLTRYMTLSDRYGEHGLISVVICRKQDEQTLFIDTWLMSCRVLRRGVEGCLFDAIVQMTLDAGFRYLAAEYLPTAKNKMVADFYSEIGMEKTGAGTYLLDCTKHRKHEHFITVN